MGDIMTEAEKTRQLLVPPQIECMKKKMKYILLSSLNVMRGGANATVFLAYFQEMEVICLSVAARGISNVVMNESSSLFKEKFFSSKE